MQFKASQQLLNPNEEPPPKKSKTNPVQDLARKHIRIAKTIVDLNVDEIVTRLTADFTLCLIFGHHDIPKFKFQMVDIIQTLPTTIHGSESFELLNEKQKITTRAQRDAKLKEKQLDAQVEPKEIDESIQQDEGDCDEEAENNDGDQAEEVTDELLNETMQYVAELVDKNEVPEGISSHFDEAADLLWIVLKSGKHNDRSSPVNFKAEEKEVLEKLHSAFRSFFLNPSPRLNHSLDVATIICSYARLLKHGKSGVKQFIKEIHGEIDEDDVESEKNINDVLTTWLEAIDAGVIKQFQRNGFKSEYPLSVREATITSGIHSVVKFFCYVAAANPEIIPANFLMDENLVKQQLENWQQHLCIDYTRKSHFHSTEKNFSEGIKDASRVTYEDEPDRIRLLTAVKIYSSTVTGVRHTDF
uniref:Uncharacterized protein n=1 Tax=Panagrolaimus superbus TaxID=310955 RepID=A0A914Z150_9BILA